VEAAEIPGVSKTSTHRTARNSTYTSTTKAVDAGLDLWRRQVSGRET
jgi:hypothetical protein